MSEIDTIYLTKDDYDTMSTQSWNYFINQLPNHISIIFRVDLLNSSLIDEPFKVETVNFKDLCKNNEDKSNSFAFLNNFYTKVFSRYS